MMASVSKGFSRSKNRIALKKNSVIFGKCFGKRAGAKKCRYNSQWRKVIPKVEKWCSQKFIMEGFPDFFLLFFLLTGGRNLTHELWQLHG
jgi:hypothetical protein